MAQDFCPVCRDLPDRLETVGPMSQEIEVDCATCGSFTLTEQADAIIKDKIRAQNTPLTAVLGYFIRRMQTQGNVRPMITKDLVEDFLKRDLPSAAEQADNLIVWLGDRTRPGDTLQIGSKDYAIFGANLSHGFVYLVKQLRARNILISQSSLHHALTFDGWLKYQELKKGRASSKKAFMAMPFGNNRLREVYSIFKGAALLAGFTLETLDERPRAGIIDNRLRVEIQTSRFLVADLTGSNLGAYWEGGFAEGLGKPVFYTCEKAHFDIERTHFDANHLYTVVWEFDKMKDAAAELKNAIRATLPDEAKMTDE